MTARQSFKPPYECACAWPDGVFLQCGSNGLVIGNPSYTTAFFEAFPELPSDSKFVHNGEIVTVLERGLFLRGEGQTIPGAESDCFARWQRACACDAHDLERRNRTDGYAFCKKCRVSGLWLQPTTICATCQKQAAYGTDRDGAVYCEPCWKQIPAEKWPDYLKRFKNLIE